MTRRDVSVWIIAAWLLIANIVSMILLGRDTGILIGNALGLGSTVLFVWYSKYNKKLNSWLDSVVFH